MSRRTGLFGGSPGPPISESAQVHHVPQQQYNQFSTGSHVYTGGGGAFDALPQGMNGADPVYFTQDGATSLMNSNFGYTPNHAYPYGSPIDAFYYGGPTYYYPHDGHSVAPQFVDNTNQYAEWSSPDFVTAPNVSPPEVIQDDPNSPNSESRSSSNESAGKSRRFSRQRNADGARSRSIPSNKPQFKSISKHEIRFSHQKKELKKKTERVETQLPAARNEENPEFDQDPRFSIIRSIGKREIDTGYEEPNDGTMETSLEVVEPKTKPTKKKEKSSSYQSSESQLSLLLEQLTKGTYECMVCCDRVKQHHAIWNCEKCYHVFHMGCIKKWARSPAAHIEHEGWRCPGCQSVNKKFPSMYNCYCGKVNEPEWDRRETPHSCGEVCGKKRSNNATCTHPCNILCHPGPCPPCPASVIKPCLCGKMTRKVRCSQQKPLMCSETCGKTKNCGLHKCEVICHSGECNLCDILVEQNCFCGKDQRNVLCGSEEFQSTRLEETNAVYSCGKKCEKNLGCGNHTCEEICHRGECMSCPLLPSNITTCPCTQTKISDLCDEEGNKIARMQCTDPVPTCDKTCGKPLKCGGDEIHTCQLKCHTGHPCPPCTDKTSTIHCRCGKSENDVPCAEIPDQLYICDRRCNKKRKCGRHKCGKVCCTDTEHQCMQICGRKLECKLHRCDETCHRGNCHTCYNVSFDELSCHCGAEVMYPPISCGTKPPECSRQCMRPHPCLHPVNHNCHNEEKCPPCVVLLKKQCNCGRVMRSNIPCYQTKVSCGAPCKKVLPCGHNCLKPCHQGPCMEDGNKCTQPCSIMRVECIHPCATPCHQGNPCPNSLCKAMVTLKCSCGNRGRQVECSEGGAMYQRLSTEAFARQQTTKGSVDISNLFQGAGKQKVLPCDEQCTAIERNRRLAEALDIDESAIELEQMIYSSFLQMWVKQDPAFVQGIEQELTNLIDAVSWLDKTKRSHTFPSMKREKRQVVHELAEVFHCKSVSVDEEPNRSVFVTAVRGVSRTPRTLLSDGIKKKPVDTAFPKHVEVPSKGPSSSSGSKRLLSSIKLVSLTSGSPSSSGNTQSSSNQAAKRPASIPRMPNYPSSSSKPPGSTPLSKAYIQLLRDYGRNLHAEGRTSYSGLPSSGQRSSLGNVSAPISARRTSSSKKDEPEIDYFDMTS